MKPPNRSNKDFPKDKVKDSKDVVLSPPLTSSSQKGSRPRPPPLKEWPPPLEQPRRSIHTITSIASFEPLSEFEISALSLPPIGDTAEYITTSTADSGVPLAEVVVAESTEVIVSSDTELPRLKTDVLEKDALVFIAPAACWSEAVEEDLLTHLGPRERVRQEGMWEIVTSEERYVAELLKMTETFINPLLHPYANASSSTVIEYDDLSQVETLAGSSEHLPIASRFLPSLAVVSDDLKYDNGRARIISHASHRGRQSNLNSSPEHDPWEPFTSWIPGDSSTLPRSSQRLRPLAPPGIARRLHFPVADLIAYGGIAPHQLPDDLRRCLESIEGILVDHLKLVEALRKRYDEQFPLVRALADIFLANLDVLRGYGTYVLHLERALEQANRAILTDLSSKRPEKNKWPEFCALVQNLEIDAQQRGETGLAISLFKPFRRLLRYPQLSQAILFHAESWIFGYEGALQLVAEVGAIVRGIEDIKIQEEKRNKTRDILARIRGLDKVKQLAVPKPSRVLLEERMLNPRASSDTGNTKAVGRKGPGSFKLSSDVLLRGMGIGSRKDVWLVVFDDVVLRCHCIGITSPSLGAAHSSAQPRNLYKFIEIENWAIDNVDQPREGVVPTEDVARSRAQNKTATTKEPVTAPKKAPADTKKTTAAEKPSTKTTSAENDSKKAAIRPQFTPIPEGDEDESLAESQDSHLGLGRHDTRQTESPSPSLYPGSSLANARFGSRLVSENSVFSGSRPPSRSTATTPSLRSLMSDEAYSVRTPTRLTGKTMLRTNTPLEGRSRSVVDLFL